MRDLRNRLTPAALIGYQGLDNPYTSGDTRLAGAGCLGLSIIPLVTKCWADHSMAWLPLYSDELDTKDLLEALKSDQEVAFIVSEGPGRWAAKRALESVPDGRYCLWHQPSGPLPLFRGAFLPAGTIKDPWAGWTEAKGGADPAQPFFGAGHPGIIWWNVRVASLENSRGIGMSSFEWIGNHYRAIGSPAHPSTENWWKQLRALVRRLKARLISREGPLDGVGREIWAMPSALARIQAGEPRDANPS